MSAGASRWSSSRSQVIVPPAFEAVRHQPRHILLGELQHALLVTISGQAAMQFQGLAQGAKHYKGIIDNRVAAKLRLVDDCAHLMHHLTPESSAAFLHQVQCLLHEQPTSQSECMPDACKTASATSGEGTSVGSDVGSSGVEEMEPDDTSEAAETMQVCNVVAHGPGDRYITAKEDPRGLQKGVNAQGGE